MRTPIVCRATVFLAAAFDQTKDSLDNLLATDLSEPDSVNRGDAVIECWHSTIKPLLDPMDTQAGDSGGDTKSGADRSPKTPRTSSPSDSGTSEQSSAAETSACCTESPNSDLGGEGPASPADSDPDKTGEHSTDGDANAAEAQARQHDQPSESNSKPDSGRDAAPEEQQAAFDPENVSLEQTQDAHSADVLAYPDIGTTEAAAELTPDDAQHTDTSTDIDESSTGTAATEAHSDPEINPTRDESDAEVSADATEDSTAGVDTESAPSDASDGSREESTAVVGVPDVTSTPDADGQDGTGDIDESSNERPRNGEAASAQASNAPNGQLSLSDFLSRDSHRSATDGHEDGSKARDRGAVGPSAIDTAASPTDVNDGDGTDDRGDDVDDESEPAEVHDGAGSTESDAPRAVNVEGERERHHNGATPGSDDDASASSDHDPPRDFTDASERSPARHTAEPAHVDALDGTPAALDADRAAAQDEAASATPDENALAQDLDETAAALEALAASRESDERDDIDTSGGRGAGEESLDSLSILPDFGDQASPARWREATAGSEAVAGTLRMALRESRRDQARTGVTSGSFDRRRAGALARGDVNAFRVRQQGQEKQYDLVLILDRSSSMSGLVSTAEDAVVRFSLACEDLGINVAIMDFLNSDPRLIKPFSVDTDHVQAGLMSGRTGGGTPLADALGLARNLLEQRRDSPLIIIITDGKPGSPDDYQTELQQCIMPVCGLTLVLDNPRGQAPKRAQDVEQFYDRHLYVHGEHQLDARLDQFAVMFDGL